MIYTKHTIDTFLVLLRAGLWGQRVWLKQYEPLDFHTLYQIADEQSVVGLLAAGIDQIEDRKVTKTEILSFLKKVYSLECRNISMNSFIETLVQGLSNNGIKTLLVKGQGIAQCYDLPLWRSSGDIDFLLNGKDYDNAKVILSVLADSTETEGVYFKHLGMSIDSWTVELHGSFRTGLSPRIDCILDEVQKETFAKSCFRVWRDGQTDILLPGQDSDVIFIFTHILQHFYKGGIGLRQLCDWSRLLWTYRESLDLELLEHRLSAMNLMTEWRAFAAFAVGFLGMPKEAMPFYDSSAQWIRRARRIQAFILEVGNFGHNRNMSYYHKYPYVVRKAISFGQRCWDLARHVAIFPLNSLRFFPSIVWNGVKSAVRGE